MRRIEGVLLTIAFTLAACGDESATVRETAVIRTIELRKVADGNVASGLDLDGITSDDRDGRTCFKADFTSPDGEPGIDNQLATLIPFVDLAGEGALQGLIQNAINEGRLLVILDVDDHGDGSVTVTPRRGDDIPLLGTDGRLLEGQTLGLHAEPVLGAPVRGTVSGDVVTTEPFALTMPIIVFSNLYLLYLPDARLRFERTEEGRLERGIIAGTAGIEDLLGLVRQAAQFGGDFEGLFGDALRDSADMVRGPDGKCSRMSAAIDFDAVPAFVFE
ncbi:hypothetical protein L6R52_12420 [Myxococcota bacterium]|nr:hypothetical protein [Myxococcota bacterium]